jgi:hypothetical protein
MRPLPHHEERLRHVFGGMSSAACFRRNVFGGTSEVGFRAEEFSRRNKTAERQCGGIAWSKAQTCTSSPEYRDVDGGLFPTDRPAGLNVVPLSSNVI